MKIRYLFITLMLSSIALLATACSSLGTGGAGASGQAVDAASQTQDSPGAAAEYGVTAAPADTADTAAEGAVVARPAGWSDNSHSNDASPNYDVVFPLDQVNQITLTISPENWATMQANMTDLYGEAGSGQGLPGMNGQPGGAPPAMPEGFQPPSGMEAPSGNGARPAGPGNFQPPGGMDGPPGGMGGDLIDENPDWVTATVTFAGQTWTNVGIRYKGNSSLSSTWNSGSLKLPFKLNFDKFEDEYPAIDNQRFYGFDTLSFANNFSDETAMRDTITHDLLDAAGLPASETAPYQVYFDYGEGPVLIGLYTAVEETDDTVIDRYFGSHDGNIYKPEGTAASLAEGVRASIADSFEIENNTDAADWSDVEALYDVLHSAQRSADPAAWRASLEAIFDVDTFLETMAINAIVENWDTYGQMVHNFYLYNDPATGQLTWISWDHNMALGSGGPGGRAGRMGPDGQGSASLDRAETTASWPLIRYLLDDPTYYARYIGYLHETNETVFVADELASQVQRLAELIGPYVAQESSQEAFDAAVQQLIDRIYQRAETTAAFLAAQ